MNIRRRWGSFWKGIKDYIVPIIGAVIIIAVLFSIFSWDSTPEVQEQVKIENKIWLEMTLDSDKTSWVIIYPWDYKKTIEWDTSIYKWEKVILKQWTASLNLPILWDIRLNKLWELKYLESGWLELKSSDMWLNSSWKVDVSMRFAKIKVWKNTNISFNQNEMGSTVYLLNGFAEVSNLVGQSTVLDSGQKLTVSRMDATKAEVDLKIQKSIIDDFYKQSDWFIINNWKNYLVSKQNWVEEKTWTWTTLWETTNSQIIKLTNIFDDSNVSSDTINISWTFQDGEVDRVVLNWVEAKLDKKLKTFIFENVSVADSENDLVFKVYDEANDLLSKFVYTVYYDWAEVTSNSWAFSVKTFDVDGTKFTFTSPTTKNTFTTYWDFVTIRWKVLEKWIKKVVVNWYSLKSFDWTTWRYHASAQNNNLSLGTNVYEIKYYWENGKVAYTNHFTIVRKKASEKKTPVPAPKTETQKTEVKEAPTKETFSDEASPN